MYTYSVLHEHRFGDTHYRFRSQKVLPITELMEGQIDRLVELLDIDFDEDEDNLVIHREDDGEVLVLSDEQVNFVLTGT